jgi:uncharacterized membrane protein
MPRQLRLYLLALSFVLGITAKAAAQDPTFTTIQPPDGNGTITFPFDINDRGEIVGAYNSAPDGQRYGFLRSRDGKFTRINFPKSVRTHADGINPRGDIVGWYARVLGEFHGYLRTKNGKFIRIDVPDAMATKAIGINPRGDIVGFYCLVTSACPPGPNEPKNAHGFLLSERELTTIDFPGAVETYAFKINRRGQILGKYLGPEGRSHLFLLSEGEFTTIDVPGAFETGVDGANAGLNSQGDVVGDYCDAPPCRFDNGTVHGFLLREGEFTTIDVPGAVATSAYGIDACGDIVGPYMPDASHAVGFLLTEDGENDGTPDERENLLREKGCHRRRADHP